MPIVRAGSARFDVDAVVFDKDDTLISLDATWGPVARLWITTVSGGDPEAGALLAARLGYDTAHHRIVPDSVLATHTLVQIGDRTLAALVDAGWDHAAAERRIADAAAVVDARHDDTPLEPLTDLVELFERLRRAGLRIGVFTSDDERPTRRFLREAGIASLIDALVTADHVERPKPHGDGLQLAAAAVGTSPDRVLMVGDSLHDHDAARAAGAWFVAVGLTTPAAALADAAVDDVGEIVAEAG